MLYFDYHFIIQVTNEQADEVVYRAKSARVPSAQVTVYLLSQRSITLEPLCEIQLYEL